MCKNWRGLAPQLQIHLQKPGHLLSGFWERVILHLYPFHTSPEHLCLMPPGPLPMRAPSLFPRHLKFIFSASPLQHSVKLQKLTHDSQSKSYQLKKIKKPVCHKYVSTNISWVYLPWMRSSINPFLSKLSPLLCTLIITT